MLARRDGLRGGQNPALITALLVLRGATLRTTSLAVSTTNYATVRAAAGLPACALGTASDAASKATEQVKNSLRTIADFHASRLSKPAYKESWRNTSEFTG